MAHASALRLSRLGRTLGRVLLWPFRLAWGFLRRLARLPLSFRAWVFFFILLIVALVAYYVLADRYTPLTTDAYVQAYVVQVAPRIDGQVVRVHVKDNDRVRRGDPLFEIDPRPFEHKVAQLEAKLTFTVQQVAQLTTDRDAARYEHERLLAEEKYARAVYDQEDRIFKGESTTERKYLDAVQKHKAAIAALDRSAKLVLRAEQALEARIGSEHALIAEVKAQLASAKLDLEWTRIFAPADGYVTDLQLREGAYARAGQAVLTCIDDGQWLVVANLRETCLERLATGQAAQVSFKSYPGRRFPAHVFSVGWGVGEGQGTPSGTLPKVPELKGWIPVAQRFQVRLALDDPRELTLRVGMSATISIYTESENHLNPVTEGLHQFLAWLDYLS
jgi:multidrug resistance efflux pump